MTSGELRLHVSSWNAIAQAKQDARCNFVGNALIQLGAILRASSRIQAHTLSTPPLECFLEVAAHTDPTRAAAGAASACCSALLGTLLRSRCGQPPTPRLSRTQVPAHGTGCGRSSLLKLTLDKNDGRRRTLSGKVKRVTQCAALARQRSSAAVLRRLCQAAPGHASPTEANSSPLTCPGRHAAARCSAHARRTRLCGRIPTRAALGERPRVCSEVPTCNPSKHEGAPGLGARRAARQKGCTEAFAAKSKGRALPRRADSWICCDRKPARRAYTSLLNVSRCRR